MTNVQGSHVKSISFRTLCIALLFIGLSVASISCSDDPIATSTLPTGTLKGKVSLNGPDTTYLDRSGVRIQLKGTSFSAVTDINGNWSIDNVPTRTYDIVFTHDGFESHTLSGQMFVGGGVVTIPTVWLVKIPTCPMILDEVRADLDAIRMYAHASCKENPRRDNAVFFLSNSSDVSSERYSHAVYNSSQTVGGVVVGFLQTEAIRFDPKIDLDLEDSIYVAAYNSGGGYYMNDEGEIIFTTLHPEPSRRIAVLVR